MKRHDGRTRSDWQHGRERTYGRRPGGDPRAGATEGAPAESASRGALFAAAKFRPTTLPLTLISRPELHDRLTAGAGKRLTVVVGSAGAGKSVLLSSWAAARAPRATSWLSCDRADANPVRFWAGFIEASREVAPAFGADAVDLLAMDHIVSPDVTASIANDAAVLPAGSVIVVDDFHVAAAAARSMTDLVERWPAENAQLVIASRSDPQVRLHRLRMSGELCELRNADLYFSLAESRDLLGNFGVEVGTADLALLHRRSEGWAAALQMAALSLRGTADPVRMARALDMRSDALGEYYVSEVLEQQPPDVARFMLDISVLGEVTADACAAVTGRHDTAALLHVIDTANLFLVALDDERTSFRYHHLVRRLLRAELRARDRAREQKLQLRAAEWYEATGETRLAARHFLAARQTDRALALLQDRVVPDFLNDPVQPGPLDLGTIAPSLATDVPDRLLAVAADMLLRGDIVHGGEYLDLLERAEPSIPAESRLSARLAAFRSFRYAVTGHLEAAVDEGLAARTIQEQTGLTDEWNSTAGLILIRVYNCLEDFPAAEREAAAAMALPGVTEPVRFVMVPGAQALGWFGAGRLAEAADAAAAAAEQARRLGFGEHFFAVDHLRTLAGLALERRDLDTAERVTEHALSIIEGRRPLFEFLALLDRAAIWAARGQVRDALATVEAARSLLPGATPAVLARADELEALLLLSLGDVRSSAELADHLPAGRRDLLLARIALVSGDYLTAQQHLLSSPPVDPTPREALTRQILAAATAIERGDPTAAGVVGGVLLTARRSGFLNTVVTTAPQVTSYLIEHSAHMRQDPFAERLTAAALEARAAVPAAPRQGHVLAEPLTAAERRILELLPTSTYLQMAATLYVSRNTIKTHLRSIYQKLGATSRSEAIERAVDLRLL